jgi:hypothetical protein
MSSEKLSISLDADLIAIVRAAAAQRGMSISTWLAEAAEAQVRQIYLQIAIDADDAEFGPMSDEEVDRIIAEARKSTIVVNGNQIVYGDQEAGVA